MTRRVCWLTGILLVSAAAGAQAQLGQLRLRLVSSLPGKTRAVPAVAWLEPLPGTPLDPFLPDRHYTLLQKDRTFIPHLQVIPVGSVVQFPNADPFFHNVFSQYEGKRFDLGLYEAGSSKSTTFTREGVSYIFCNIHPEMSAVIVALSTRLYAIADAKNTLVVRDIPPGDYRLHLWIESVPESFLRQLTRTVHIEAPMVDLGRVIAPIAGVGNAEHLNKFGRPYDTKSTSPY